MKLDFTKKQLKDIESVLDYIFEHETEDYNEQLTEYFPDDADYIAECVQEGNQESLDKYAWNGTTDIPHVYAPAVRLWKLLHEQKAI